jgi:hypothetical protein
MKSVLDLRPVYHRLEDGIRAHVLLCWLALLLVRVAETTTGRTWPTIRAELQRLHAITYTGAAGTARRPPNLPRPNGTCSPPSRSTPPSASSTSSRQPSDQGRQPASFPSSERVFVYQKVTSSTEQVASRRGAQRGCVALTGPPQCVYRASQDVRTVWEEGEWRLDVW